MRWVRAQTMRSLRRAMSSTSPAARPASPASRCRMQARALVCYGVVRAMQQPVSVSTRVVSTQTCKGGHTHAGSAATQSKAGPAVAPGKQRGTGRRAQAESAGPAPVFFESQQSFHEGAGAGTKRTRKASCVELPIHQVGSLQSGIFRRQQR